MTPQDEREAIARVIAPAEWQWFDEDTKKGIASDHDVAVSLQKADAILALRQPGAEYRRGLLEAADRFEARVHEGYPLPAQKVDQCEHGQFGWEDCIACYDQVLLAEIEAIRLLPDTKGEGRG